MNDFPFFVPLCSLAVHRQPPNLSSNGNLRQQTRQASMVSMLMLALTCCHEYAAVCNPLHVALVVLAALLAYKQSRQASSRSAAETQTRDSMMHETRRALFASLSIR